MTAKQKYDKAKTWQRKVTLISFYHLYMGLRKQWTIRKTAKYFGISVGNVSESLRLAEHIDKVKSQPSRKKALEALWKMN